MIRQRINGRERTSSLVFENCYVARRVFRATKDHHPRDDRRSSIIPRLRVSIAGLLTISSNEIVERDAISSAEIFERPGDFSRLAWQTTRRLATANSTETLKFPRHVTLGTRARAYTDKNTRT